MNLPKSMLRSDQWSLFLKTWLIVDTSTASGSKAQNHLKKYICLRCQALENKYILD